MKRNWRRVIWTSRDQQDRFCRLVTGKTRLIRIPVDVLVEAYAESPVIREYIEPRVTERRAIEYITENGIVANPGTGKGVVDGKSNAVVMSG